MRRRVHILFALLMLLATACDNTPEVSRPSVLRSITCEQTTFALEAGGTVEVEFHVEEPKALFNYVVSSPKCEVKLCMADNVLREPEGFRLRSVREGTTRGQYVALLEDSGSGVLYDERINIVIHLESGLLVRSNAINIISGDIISNEFSVKLLKNQNPTLNEDVVFSLDVPSQSLRAHLEEYYAERSFVPTIVGEDIRRIEIDGVEWHGEAVDMSTRRSLRIVGSQSEVEYTLHLTCFTALPVVRIETPGGQGVWSKDVWVEGSMLWLDGMGRFEDIEAVEMAIRGRGNSTWGYEKKPYAIKFTEKQRVMGMPKHKRWVLLANYMDRTLLRNRVAYYLAQQTSLEWTPRCEFVELILNGEHLGQYLLTEQVRVDNDRIAITEMSTADNSGEAVTGGYLLELDFHYDNLWQWTTAHGVPFAVKFPDEEDLTEQQLAWIKGYIDEAESGVYAGRYEEYIDAQSFIDYWLIYEICVNHELGNPGSVYLQKDRGGKLVAGPVWDFDWGTFSYNASPHAQYGLFITWAWWYDRLFKEEAFWQLARERWRVLKPKFETVFDFIDEEREYIEVSWRKNFDRWGISTDINGDEKLSFGAAIDRLYDITQERIDIIDRELK